MRENGQAVHRDFLTGGRHEETELKTCIDAGPLLPGKDFVEHLSRQGLAEHQKRHRVKEAPRSEKAERLLAALRASPSR